MEEANQVTTDNALAPVETDRVTLLKNYAAIRENKDALKSELSMVQKALDLAEEQLVACMENENLQSFNDQTYGTIYLRGEVYVGIDNFQALQAWLRSNDLKDIIKQTIHNSTLRAIVKEHGDAVLGVNTHYVTKIGVRRNKA